MDFTTPFFLFFSLPVFLCIYWLAHTSIRLYLLLAGSLFFYAWGDMSYVPVLVIAITFNYVLAIILDRLQEPSNRLIALFCAIVINLLFLLAFKYPALTQWLTGDVNQLHLPLGISFFTFQAIGYAIDVYHRTYTPSLNPLRYSLFLSLFPKISAGPIIRYSEVEKSLIKPVVDIDSCAYGAKRFVIGLGKKILIADTLAKTADQIFAIPTIDLTAPIAWLGIICYTLQLYFDFSGYSDMAIGLGRMLGFTFRENFDYPYIAKSLTEFWRRWHISLSTWFRDYLYTPLLYSLMTKKIREKIANGKYRTNYRSLFCIVVVFTLCGWWHGSTWNFVIWGLLHGFILAGESWKLGKLLKKAPAFISHGYFLLVIMLCWVFFRSPTLGGAIAYLKALAGLGAGAGVAYNLPIYLNNELLLILPIAIVSAMPTTKFIYEKKIVVFRPSIAAGWPKFAVEVAATALILFFSLMSVANSTYRAFIYFRF